MLTTLNPIISKLGYSVIRWNALFEKDLLNDPDAALRLSPREPQEKTPVFEKILHVARPQLLQRPVNTWPVEFKALKNTLIKQMAISDDNQANFNVDYEAFVYFMYFSLNEKESAPEFHCNADSRPRVQRMFTQLLQGRFNDLAVMRINHMNQLMQLSHELKALAPLAQWDTPAKGANAASSRYLATIMNTLVRWIKLLFHYLSLLASQRAVSECPYAYAIAANHLWDLALKFGLQAHLQTPDVQQTLHQAYQKTIDIMVQPAPNSETLLSMDWKVAPRRSLSTQLSTLNKAFNADLESLTYWGSSHFRRAILTAQSSEKDAHQKGIDQYLFAFQVTHQRIEAFSAALYAFRNHLDDALRADKRAYCQHIDMLNANMLSIDQRLVELERSWLKETLLIAPGTALVQASQCLGELLSEPVRALSQITWAEHTAYCSLRTEERFAFEMELRTPLEKYSLSTTQTQSDYVIYHYWPEQYGKVRKMLLKVHPDRFNQDKALLPIAEFCTEYLIQLRERAEKLTQLWNLSQWADCAQQTSQAQNEGPTEETSPEMENLDGAMDVKVDVATAPKNPLTLSVLLLNKHYQSWCDLGHSLTKTTQQVEPQYRMYGNGLDEGFHIAYFNMMKQQYTANRKSLANKLKIQKELIAEIKEIQAERDQAQAELDQAQADLYDSTINYINMLIDEEIEKTACYGAPETLRNLKSILAKQVARAFKMLTPEEISERIDTCINPHFPAPQAPHHAANPVGFFVRAPAEQIANVVAVAPPNIAANEGWAARKILPLAVMAMYLGLSVL